MVNSVVPDQMPHDVTSDLGLTFSSGQPVWIQGSSYLSKRSSTQLGNNLETLVEIQIFTLFIVTWTQYWDNVQENLFMTSACSYIYSIDL